MPTFQVDYNQCGNNPVISVDAVDFGDGSICNAGRVVSEKRYKKISKVTATIDLSKLGQNYVNAAFYVIENSTSPRVQPKGNDYCDAGGNKNEWNCREIDFLETNGNKITQTSMHLGNGGIKAPQRYEYSFAATANNGCFNYSAMLASPTHTNGLHSLVDKIDMSKPFDMITTFTYGTIPSMKTSFSQLNMTVVVYDTTVGSGAEGSGALDYQDLIPTMDNGYWFVVSFWQGYSPMGPRSNPWWNGSCNQGDLCNSVGFYWAIRNVEITAEGEL
jgi:hypothetical protein